jgi:hypothetical protein
MPNTARRFLAVLEPVVSMIFFAPEAAEAYAALGLDPIEGYFCSRSAAMGRVAAEVVAAVFFNFNPELVAKSLKWDVAPPEVVVKARHEAARAALQRLLPESEGAPVPDVSRAVELLKVACAGCRPEGRPLYAAHARLPWPADDLTALWFGGNLLREYRGDGHIAVLLSHQVDAVEALLLHSPFIGGRRDVLLGSRMWDEATAAAASERLSKRGLLKPDGPLTDAGEKFREMIELETDRLATAPFDALGPEGCDELIAILRPHAVRIAERRGVPKILGRYNPEDPLV